MPTQPTPPGHFLGPCHPFLPALVTFAAASAVGLALLGARFVVTGRVTFYYLPWNLFLAWIPFVLALVVWRLVESDARRRGLVVLCGVAWLLFFPNAPYLCTDLVHLTRLASQGGSPFWFDLLVNLIFVVTGLLLGLASLTTMQQMVSRRYGARVGWLFAMSSLALAGFGIYLGRFLRWNSWDALTSPLALLGLIVDCLRAPLEHRRTWGFSLVCFLFLLLSYLMCRNLAGLQSPRLERSRS
jgi:uncharacterized membrane protein